MCEQSEHEDDLAREGYRQWLKENDPGRLAGYLADQFTTVSVEISGQQIVELAYAIKDLTENTKKQRLSFEQANCYASTSRFVGDLLGQVCLLYLAQHPELSDFYNYGGRMDLLGEAP